MVGPAADLDLVVRSTRRLLATVDRITDAQAAEPSLLPGWTRAEVLTHLARNADSVTGLVDATRRGEVGVQYPGGAEQRAADIAAGRGERASALLVDLRRSCDRVFEALRSLRPDEWERPTRAFSGTRLMKEWPWSRAREVEVHHVDLDLGYSAADWPIGFVARGLDDAMRTLPARATATRPWSLHRVRVEATDHGRAWIVDLDGQAVAVHDDDGHPAEAVVTGWGCDLYAWLQGRPAAAGTVTAAGEDVSVLRLPTWFPYP